MNVIFLIFSKMKLFLSILLSVPLLTSALRQVVYLSHSVNPTLTHDELQDIVITCRRRNTLLGITGLLLYRDGSVVQYLEGTEVSIRLVLESIKRDPRHTGMLFVLDREIDKRDFPTFSIAFQNPDYTKAMNEWADTQSKELTEDEQKAFDNTLAAVNDPPQMSRAIARLIELYQRVLLHMEPHPRLQNQWSRANKVGMS